MGDMQPEPQPADRHDIRQTALTIFLRGLDEIGGALKLVLGVSTGAAVLLINVLANQHFPRIASWVFASSVLFFGAAAILCLLLLLALANLQIAMAKTLSDQSPNWPQEFNRKIDNWKKRGRTMAKLLECFFGLGILLAAASVIVLVLVR
jgi:hypothetical protein